MRTPSDPEDFLHGAACHCCSFASETSCEKANRFLDRALGRRLATVALAALREGAADREPVAEAVEDAPPTAAGALGASLDSRLVLLRSC